jgi:hypothetical protein
VRKPPANLSYGSLNSSLRYPIAIPTVILIVIPRLIGSRPSSTIEVPRLLNSTSARGSLGTNIAKYVNNSSKGSPKDKRLLHSSARRDIITYYASRIDTITYSDRRDIIARSARSSRLRIARTSSRIITVRTIYRQPLPRDNPRTAVG